MVPESKWTTVLRPGWFGEAKDKRLASFDEAWGKGNWRIRHQFGPRLLSLEETLRLYELSYELHFLNPDTRFLWTNLFQQASEVWTELESDVNCGMDYSTQNHTAQHYEDMAIRIIMKRYGYIFKGDHLIRIRADSLDPLGVALSSIHIPFIFPQFIEPDLDEIAWWNRHKGSLEHFWHNNKVLQVKSEIIKALNELP